MGTQQAPYLNTRNPWVKGHLCWRVPRGSRAQKHSAGTRLSPRPRGAQLEPTPRGSQPGTQRLRPPSSLEAPSTPGGARAAGAGLRPRAGQAPSGETGRRPPGVPRPHPAREPGRGRRRSGGAAAAQSRGRHPRAAGADAARDGGAAGAGPGRRRGRGRGRERLGPRPRQVRADSRARWPPRTGSPPAAGRTAARSPPPRTYTAGAPGREQEPTAWRAAGPSSLCGRSPYSELALPYRRPRRHPPAHARGQSGPALRSGFYERRRGQRGGERREEGSGGKGLRTPRLPRRHTSEEGLALSQRRFVTPQGAPRQDP
ncbi:collagen alpha-1(I) chain-like [Hyaena hyaena]|uniref:collagen alpha-1(I) chain-like n=1 Tax=Hyaena hyaena TaxID=95912 RepID=UPI001924C2A7|nr:collagen alpha-1(I) chain-like [Hyaena hyaena]